MKTTAITKPVFKCNICKVSYSRKDYLKLHLQSVHNIGATIKPECLFCQKIVPSHLENHMRCHTKEAPFSCKICQAEFRQRQHLNSHSKLHDNLRFKQFQCDLCPKKFHSKCAQAVHMKAHLREKPYKCNVCGKEFRTNQKLKSHKITHTNEKPFKCDVCNKQFKQKRYLSRHKVVHEGHKDFSCEICNKTFARKDALQLHKRGIHSEEKPYCCEICLKRFTHSGNLTGHMRVHTGETPFSCNQCGRRFKRSGHLKSHVLSAHFTNKM